MDYSEYLPVINLTSSVKGRCDPQMKAKAKFCDRPRDRRAKIQNLKSIYVNEHYSSLMTPKILVPQKARLAKVSSEVISLPEVIKSRQHGLRLTIKENKSSNSSLCVMPTMASKSRL